MKKVKKCSNKLTVSCRLTANTINCVERIVLTSVRRERSRENEIQRERERENANSVDNKSRKKTASLCQVRL